MLAISPFQNPCTLCDLKIAVNDCPEFSTHCAYCLHSRLQMMWHITLLDIESTIRHVCTKVTHDHSVDEETRNKRKVALKILGELFSEKGGYDCSLFMIDF